MTGLYVSKKLTKTTFWQTNIILLSKDAGLIHSQMYPHQSHRKSYTDILLVTLQDFPYDRHYSAIGALILLVNTYLLNVRIRSMCTIERPSLARRGCVVSIVGVRIN